MPALALLLGALLTQQTVTPNVGLSITHTVRLTPGDYLLAAQGDKPAVTISGNNIVVDCTGVTLRGTLQTTEPDQRKGLGLLVTGKNVTLKGLKVTGYMHGVIARNAPNINIQDCDFSYNQKQHLLSTPEKEDLSDWMSFHHNENDEWLSNGIALYLDRCDGFEIKNLRVHGGQCAVMLNRSNDGLLWNSNLSFNSALGLGMYRSSNNRIMHNKIDWDVRGYSHGVYNRGQDSAGILIYEQSNNNVFAYNSVTHGGDGFFLWAGQSTMDTGEGGCNDNLVYGNDFSHAPTNGIEATFSRNVFANNLVLECWHAVWGGYSYESKIVGNIFGLNAEGVSIEHGQDNLIQGNIFPRNLNDIQLWANPGEDPNWGYPKHRDTASKNYQILANSFLDTTGLVFDLAQSKDVDIVGNLAKRNNQLFKLKDNPGPIKVENNVFQYPLDTTSTAPASTMTNRFGDKNAQFVSAKATMQAGGNPILGMDPTPAEYAKRFSKIKWTGLAPLKSTTKTLTESTPEERRQAAAFPYRVSPLPGGMDPFLKPGDLRGRRYIIVDQWGPYDFLSPRLVLSKQDGRTMTFDVYGPAGMWRLKHHTSNLNLDHSAGVVPGKLVVTNTGEGNFDLELVYRGKQTTDYRGIVTPAGQSVDFGYSQNKTIIDWTVKFWNYDSATQDPRTQKSAFDQALSKPPVLTQKTTELSGAWGGSPGPGINPDYFATVAEGDFSVPKGNYILDVTSDDGVRVWLDGKLVLDDWTYHGPKNDQIKLTLSGKHHLTVRHFELNGYSTLQVKVRKP